MNEEEKKAIEELSKKAVFCNYEERDYPSMICFKKDMLIVLNLIEKLQKENEELKADNYELNNRITDLLENIPVQKIKDIIDRIDYDIKKTKEIISNNSNIYTSDRRNDYQIARLRAMNTKSLDIKKRLQELIEESEKK